MTPCKVLKLIRTGGDEHDVHPLGVYSPTLFDDGSLLVGSSQRSSAVLHFAVVAASQAEVALLRTCS